MYHMITATDPAIVNAKLYHQPIAHLPQETKQTRRRNSVGDLSQKKKTQTMADKVIEALINPTVLNQMSQFYQKKLQNQ